MEKLELLRKLCSDYFAKFPDDKKVSIYYLISDKTKKLAAGQIHRIGGAALLTTQAAPVIIDPETDEILRPMQHVFTLDLSTMPKLKELLGSQTKAFAFFADMESDYFEMMPISESQICEIPFSEDSYSFDVFEVEVPESAFEMNTVLDDYWAADPEAEEAFLDVGDFSVIKDAKVKSIIEIHERLLNAPAYVLGKPIFFQPGDYQCPNFLMQFSSRFSGIGWGDSGIMYLDLYNAPFYLTH